MSSPCSAHRSKGLRVPAGARPAGSGLRFACVYLVLYILPFPLNYVPGCRALAELYEAAWHAAVPWVAQLVLHIQITVFPNGSGDTTYNYVQVACLLALAGAASLLWSLLGRTRPDPARLHGWLRVYVRFYLASQMLLYGADKVIQAQFPPPQLFRLLEPYGNSSPMGLLWFFMGSSRLYAFFGGAAEMLGGLLLTARRTTLLGALVSAGVMANVLMLNLSYDVPVKLLSAHLVLMSLFLAAPDAGRLVRMFVLNRAVAPAPLPAPRRPGLHRAALVLRTMLVLAFTAQMFDKALLEKQWWDDLVVNSPLRGIWNVEEFSLDGEAQPPLLTDPVRWRRVLFELGDVATYSMEDRAVWYRLQVDTAKKSVTMTNPKVSAMPIALQYREPDPGILELDGTLNGKVLHVRARLQDETQFPLLSRGFHWINEYSFNR